MNQPALTAEELIAWLDRTSENWRGLIEDHPEILALPCDIMNVQTVAGLLQHIVAVELRFAERLAGLPVTDYANIPADSAASLYATHERAALLLREQLTQPIDWKERLEFTTRVGAARSSRRAMFFHAIFHSVRHYAQLATLVRQLGIKPGWPMDYLSMDMERL